MKSFLSGFPKYDLVKVMHNKTTKDISDNMLSCYEGDKKVKKSKIQGLKM